MLRSVTLLLSLLSLVEGCNTALHKEPLLITQDYRHLLDIRESIEKKSPLYLEAYHRLCKEADFLVSNAGEFNTGIFSIRSTPIFRQEKLNSAGMDLPAFNSGIYPGRGKGEPDNPEQETSFPGAERLEVVVEHISTLSLAWFYTGEEKYASMAAALINNWFLVEDCPACPPSMEGSSHRLAHGPPGIEIIDTRKYIEVLDAISLIRSSKAWGPAKTARIRHWFSGYVDWLLESETGISESRKINCYGTWYDAQLASFAFFTGERDLMQSVILNAMNNRLGEQIDAKGMQPFEFSGPNAFSNAILNLEAHFILARIAEWNNMEYRDFEKEGKGSLKDACDYLFSYIPRMDEWPFNQADEVDPRRVLLLVLESKQFFNDPSYKKYIEVLIPELKSNDRIIISKI